uniref:Uncharacterized protein n=1 Tax=Caenorhabditis japonica TaxID=281687 RepID=A0A8R1HUW9_CAEJA
MKLFVHNFMSSRFLKNVTVGYPLELVVKQFEERDIEYDRQSTITMLEKVQYDGLLVAAAAMNLSASIPAEKPAKWEELSDDELKQMGIRTISSTFLLIFALVFGTQKVTSTFCENYVTCMEQLEIKQHECLALDRNVRLRSSDLCSRQKWDQKLELNALHMRRAEMAKDCAQKHHQDAELAESTLDEETRKQCESLHEKFQFAKLSSTQNSMTSSSAARKKRATGKRNKRETTKKNSSSKATECRNAAKLWHKQCSALAKCCPLAEECKQSTMEIMNQIYEGRHKLHDMHRNNCV